MSDEGCGTDHWEHLYWAEADYQDDDVAQWACRRCGHIYTVYL